MDAIAELQHEIRRTAHDIAGVQSFLGNCVTLAHRGDYGQETLVASLAFAEAKLDQIRASLARDPAERRSEARAEVMRARAAWLATQGGS